MIALLVALVVIGTAVFLWTVYQDGKISGEADANAKAERYLAGYRAGYADGYEDGHNEVVMVIPPQPQEENDSGPG